MTDARLPARWLNHPHFDDLSDVAWRVFTGALMWSNERGTDGAIPKRYLKMLHPDGEFPDAFEELVQAKIWCKTDEGYFLLNWDKDLGQATAEYVENNRENARKRQAKWRQQNSKSNSSRTPSFVDSSDVTRDITRDVTQENDSDVGQDRTETKKVTDEEKIESNNDQFWPVVEIPKSERTNACFICGSLLAVSLPADRALCDVNDKSHNEAFAFITQRIGGRQTA